MLVAWMLAGGCETSFDPFVETDAAVSVVGYLDVAADTQFVRVERLRDSLLTGSGPVEAQVFLEHPASGGRTRWRDSLFSFRTGGMAHNFWSTERLRAGETYRLVVDPAIGARASATVTLPDSFPDPVLPDTLECLTLDNSCLQKWVVPLELQGMANPAAVTFLYYHPDFDAPAGCAVHRVHYWRAVERGEEGGFRVELRWKEDLERAAFIWTNVDQVPDVLALDVYVADGGPGWPDFNLISRETYYLPDAVSNIENGTGFLGGVFSKTVRLFGDESRCDDRPPPPPPPVGNRAG